MTNSEYLISRHAETRVREALKDTRIVALVGPRQSGKSTLASKFASENGMLYLSLDDEATLMNAKEDPRGFFKDIDRAVIDEIQRQPSLILALKRSVDTDTRPGRFIITGSVDLFRTMITPDSLAGRIEIIELLPFSQAEVDQRASADFLEHAFDCNFPGYKEVGFTTNLVERVITGGYPEAIRRPDFRRRRKWMKSYINGLASRDVSEISEINKLIDFRKFIDYLATSAGQIVKLDSFARDNEVDKKTVDRWLTLLEYMFIVRRVRPWYRNNLKRLIKKPKLHFYDSGVLATILKVSKAKIRSDRGVFGQILEGFVFSELYKLIEQNDEGISIFHYRDLQQYEIDFMLELDGRIVAIEVKANIGIKSEDFKAMKRLKEAIGSSFACGIVLNTGDRIQRMGEKLYAMPLSQLWS